MRLSLLLLLASLSLLISKCWCCLLLIPNCETILLFHGKEQRWRQRRTSDDDDERRMKWKLTEWPKFLVVVCSSTTSYPDLRFLFVYSGIIASPIPLSFILSSHSYVCAKPSLLFFLESTECVCLYRENIYDFAIHLWATRKHQSYMRTRCFPSTIMCVWSLQQHIHHVFCVRYLGINFNTHKASARENVKLPPRIHHQHSLAYVGEICFLAELLFHA